MLILVPHKVKVENVLSLAAKAAWALTGLACFVFAVCTIYSLRESRQTEELLRSPLSFPRLTHLALEKIGQGPLSLHSKLRKTILPDLSQEILLLGKNARPDLQTKEVTFLLSLRSSRLERKVKSDEVVFLTCDPQSGGAPVYRFSEKKTPLWIRLSLLDKSKVLIETGLFMPAKEAEGFLEERAQFILQEDASSRKSGAFESEAWMSTLKQAKLWGPDVMLAKYGGKDYSWLAQKFKLEIPSLKGTVFCFVESGDFLVWEAGAWAPAESMGKVSGRPVAQIKAVSTREIELEVWNEEGFYPEWIKIEGQLSSRRGAAKAGQIPDLVRARTSQQVSCSFAKRRYLLKPGDWILKTSRGWKVLKRPSDVQDYLLHKAHGELCVFETLVREQGKLMMKGFSVDAMRTQMIPFSLPVEGDKSLKKQAAKTRKGSFPRPVTTHFPPSFQKSKEAS